MQDLYYLVAAKEVQCSKANYSRRITGNDISSVEASLPRIPTETSIRSRFGEAVINLCRTAPVPKLFSQPWPSRPFKGVYWKQDDQEPISDEGVAFPALSLEARPAQGRFPE